MPLLLHRVRNVSSQRPLGAKVHMQHTLEISEREFFQCRAMLNSRIGEADVQPAFALQDLVDTMAGRLNIADIEWQGHHLQALPSKISCGSFQPFCISPIQVDLGALLPQGTSGSQPYARAGARYESYTATQVEHSCVPCVRSQRYQRPSAQASRAHRRASLPGGPALRGWCACGCLAQHSTPPTCLAPATVNPQGPHAHWSPCWLPWQPKESGHGQHPGGTTDTARRTDGPPRA